VLAFGITVHGIAEVGHSALVWWWSQTVPLAPDLWGTDGM
jgi:hypothetical protein